MQKRLLASDQVCLITQPEVALVLGRSEAIFLQQLHYWLTTSNSIGAVVEGRRWVYNSYPSWQENIKILSISTIRRVIKKLEDSEILLSRNLNRQKSDKTKWYSIDYDRLKELIPTISSESKMSRPSVQNEQIINRKTKTTSDINTHAEGFLRNVEKKESGTSGAKDQELVQKMIDIWNECVEEGREVIQLTSRRAAFLKKALSDKFHNSLDEWKSYCRSVASSPFLTGKIKSTFKATLDWALKFETIQRILEGAYGVKPVEIASNQEEGGLIHDIQDSEEEWVVKLIRSELLDNFGAATYRSWFKDLKILQQGSVISVVTDTAFRRDCIRNRFESDLQKIISSFSDTQSSLCLNLT